MNARKDRKLRALLLAGLFLVPGMQGCNADVMGFMKKLHPYVGKLLGSAGKKDDGAKAPEAPKDTKDGKDAKAGGTEKPADDGARAKEEKDAKKVEQL